MSIIIHSIEIVAPLLIFVALGALLNYRKGLSQNTINEVIALVSKFFLPATIFIHIYNSNIRKDFDIRLFVFITFVFILAVLINNFYISYFVKDDRQKSVLLQASIRSNCTLFALPLSIYIYGDSIAGMASLAAVIITNLNNLYCIYVFEHFQYADISFTTLLLRVLRHPLTIGLLLGLSVQILQFRLPAVILKCISQISQITSPVALMIIGASFIFRHSRETVKNISLAVVYKLVIYPAIGLVLAYWLGFRNEGLVVIVALLASPVAVNSFLTAKSYNCDTDLSNAALVYSYMLATVTLPIFISLITYLNLI
ncbi:MAG TPA: AEC family transporter [Erysipelotrichaceae bacterium]|nr:AEC family transporter [Erysipelotrichaceae bacterium]HQB31780.1 AEC family transporter [Erysipelotrichaceae bacterium]